MAEIIYIGIGTERGENMISQTLREARKYEEASEKMIPKGEKPAFHLAARTGWMNDPNGFSYYDGKYHLFYQYNPYDVRWDTMHWAHAVSDDLLHWEHLPAELAPLPLLAVLWEEGRIPAKEIRIVPEDFGRN